MHTHTGGKALAMWTMGILCMVVLAVPASQADDCTQAREVLTRAERTEAHAADLQALLAKEGLYRQAIALCPSSAEAHNNLGDVYEQLGLYAEAIAAYQRAVQLQSTAPFPYFGLGDVYFKSGKYAEAIAWYDKGLALAPNDQVTLERRRQAQALLPSMVIPSERIVEVLSRDLREPGDKVKSRGKRGPGDKVKMTFGSDAEQGLIPFDFGKSDIRENAKAQLNELGKALSTPALAKETWEIGGHTDRQGSDDINLVLSLERAKAVRNYLVQHFMLHQERLTVKGYGKRNPLAPGDDEGSHALNRRVEIVRLSGLQAAVSPPPGHPRPLRRVPPPHSAAQPATSAPQKRAVALDLGFFYKDGQTGHRLPLRSDGSTVLQTGRNPYQIFFRPKQRTYVYLLQKDATGTWYHLFPQHGSAPHSNPVQAGQEYWIPGFDEGFGLDKNTGEETLYFLASLSPVPDLEGTPAAPKEIVVPIIRGVGSRGITEGTLPPGPPAPGAIPDYAKVIKEWGGQDTFARSISFQHQ